MLLGGAGNDVLRGGNGNDILSGGQGADEFLFTSSAAVDLDSIVDYSYVDGDKLTLSALLDDGFAPGNNVSDFVKLEQDANNNIAVMVDADGTAGGVSFTTVATLLGYGTGSAADPVKLFFEGQDHILKI